MALRESDWETGKEGQGQAQKKINRKDRHAENGTQTEAGRQVHRYEKKRNRLTLRQGCGCWSGWGLNLSVTTKWFKFCRVCMWCWNNRLCHDRPCETAMNFVSVYPRYYICISNNNRLPSILKDICWKTTDVMPKYLRCRRFVSVIKEQLAGVR